MNENAVLVNVSRMSFLIKGFLRFVFIVWSLYIHVNITSIFFLMRTLVNNDSNDYSLMSPSERQSVTIHSNIYSTIESFFTNVPIKKTINDHTISKNLKKRSLKKLILDTCTKTEFSFNNIIYKQKTVYTWVLCLGLL